MWDSLVRGWQRFLSARAKILSRAHGNFELQTKVLDPSIVIINYCIIIINAYYIFFCGAAAQRGPWPSYFWGF